MILYSDNPNLKLKVVKTVTGEKEYRINCKHILDAYHVIDKDCFEINGKWYRKCSGKIAFDYELREWKVIQDNPQLIKGVIGFKDKTPIFEFFTPNVYNNVAGRSKKFGNFTAINKEILLENNYIEEISNCVWYDKDEWSEADIKKFQSIRAEKDFKHKGYNIEDNVEEFAEKKKTYKNYPLSISREVIPYGKILGDTTIGIEIETSAGNCSNNFQYRHGVVSCRDGSIGGAEWVTVPMGGVKCLQNIVTIAEELSKRCNVDINCSYHIHFGNIPLDRGYMVALYILCHQIQDDVFKMFPYYKTNPDGIKHKNYCQKLDRLHIYPLQDKSKEGYKGYVNEVYEDIFKFLSDGAPADINYNRQRKKHPIREKWNRKSR